MRGAHSLKTISTNRLILILSDLRDFASPEAIRIWINAFPVIKYINIISVNRFSILVLRLKHIGYDSWDQRESRRYLHFE